MIARVKWMEQCPTTTVILKPRRYAARNDEVIWGWSVSIKLGNRGSGSAWAVPHALHPQKYAGAYTTLHSLCYHDT